MTLLLIVIGGLLAGAAVLWTPTDEVAARFDERTLERLRGQVEGTRARDRGWGPVDVDRSVLTTTDRSE